MHSIVNDDLAHFGSNLPSAAIMNSVPTVIYLDIIYPILCTVYLKTLENIRKQF